MRMKNSYVLFLMAVFMTCLDSTLVSCSGGPKGHSEYEVTTRHGEMLKVYARPDDRSAVVGTLESGTLVTPVGYDYPWVAVEFEGDTCYVSNDNIVRNYIYDEDEAEYEARKGTVNLGFARVKWYWLLAIFVIALMIPPVRYVIRWITFIPLAIIGCVLFDLLQPAEFIAGLILHEILPYWGTIVLDVISGALQFAIMIVIGRLVCPNSRIGGIVTAAVGIILVIYHIIADKQATMLYVDSTPEQIDWLHTCVMLVTYVTIGLAISFFGDDDD